MDASLNLPLDTPREKAYPQRLIKPFLQRKLGTEPTWALHGLLRIFERQTADEQRRDVTVERNGVGFTGMDAEILSSFAHQIKQGRMLSEKQMTIVFEKMPKYWRQLLEVSDAKKLHAAIEKEGGS